MLKKKIVCCLGYILTSVIGTQVFAAPVVTTTQNGIIVTAKGDVGVPVTATMSKDENAQIIGLLQGTFGDDGKCEFVFDYPEEGGAYTFSVNSHRYAGIESAPYYQTDEEDRITLYSEFLSANNLQSFYVTNEIKLSIDMQEGSDYYSLADKTAVYRYISSNKNTVRDYYGIAEIFNKAVEAQKEKEYQLSLDKEAIDALNSAAVTDKKEVIDTYNNRFGFDITYELGYKKLTDSKYSEQFKKVMQSLTGLPYDMVKVVEIFDKNVLLQSFNVSRAKDAESLIAHYGEFFEELDSTNYKKLHDVDKMTILNNVLKKCPYTDISDIVADLKTEIKKIKTTSTGGSNSSGGGGNRGGGSSSGVGVIVGNIDNVNSNNNNVTPAVKPFNDIDGVEWAKESIEKLYELGIVNGTGEKAFSPDEYVTREQFVKMLIGVIGEKETADSGEFNDVMQNQWYSGYIAKAHQLGIVMGDTDGNFGVGKNITREDLAVLIYRAIEKKNISLSGGNVAEYKDSEQISAYATEAVSKLSSQGIINGFEDNTFGPKRFATRAQAAKLLYGVYKLSGGEV